MKILSHRGYWNESLPKNSYDSFQRSFAAGFGTETDFRDRDGELVIAHDVANQSSLPASEFFSLAARFEGLPLALNIKADGLVDLVGSCLDAELRERSFVFDMAVPDMRTYLDSSIRVFTRHSDVETLPPWVDACDGVWLDSFGPQWFDGETIERHLDSGLDVCVVSPELHGRDPESVWTMLRTYRAADRLFLCTDDPEVATNFMGME